MSEKLNLIVRYQKTNNVAGCQNTSKHYLTFYSIVENGYYAGYYNEIFAVEFLKNDEKPYQGYNNYKWYGPSLELNIEKMKEDKIYKSLMNAVINLEEYTKSGTFQGYKKALVKLFHKFKIKKFNTWQSIQDYKDNIRAIELKKQELKQLSIKIK